MLPARRDPVFDHGTHKSSASSAPGHADIHAVPRPTGFARLVAGMQILGTVLGIPLGLASGYSIYRANFSPEARCGNLRANIISMLDKNADASTLRLLVRHDVASFEHACGAVDPDAVAAFKTLLVKPGAVAAAKGAKLVETERRAMRAQPVRSEPAKRVAVKRAPVRHNPDADWLAAVRRALVEHAPVTRAHAAEAPMPLAPSRARMQAAPSLPSATRVADAPEPQKNDGHPVPPALIPNVGPGVSVR